MWLKMTKAAEGGVRLLWGSNDGPYEPAYHIGSATLQQACDAVRTALTRLVTACGSHEPRVRWAALRALATAGAELHYNLLYHPLHASEAQAAAQVRGALGSRYKQGDTKLRITGHPEIHVPWGLVFDGNPDAIPRNPDTVPTEEEQLVSFGEFWSLKYDLSSTLSGYTNTSDKLLRKPEKSVLLSLMHEQEAKKAEAKLWEFDDGLLEDYKELLARPVGVAHDLASCWQLIDKVDSSDAIFHIFTHQSEGKLELGDDEPIYITKFKMLLDILNEVKESAPPYGLVILNACESATGNQDYSFINAVTHPNMSGLIGTEANVPRDFALPFAVYFLRLMLKGGKSVGEALKELRRKPNLWPLSLLYGCYAQPDYRIVLDHR